MRLLSGLAITVLLAACDHHGDSDSEGEATGAVCPTPSTLSYETFGRAFMESYCTSCHDSAKSGASRNGAPEFHDFDTLNGIKAVSEHVDERAAAGPDATNEGMPRGDGPRPTLAEREMLGEWIACGMP